MINGKHYSEITSVEGGDKDVYILNSNEMATKNTIYRDVYPFTSSPISTCSFRIPAHQHIL
jgi:hypothetical protein